MLDSDNLPLRDPEFLFNTTEYKRSGTLFFSDWWDMTEWVKPEAYTAFKLQYPGHERPLLALESGQLLLNRQARSWQGLRKSSYCSATSIDFAACSVTYLSLCLDPSLTSMTWDDQSAHINASSFLIIDIDALQGHFPCISVVCVRTWLLSWNRAIQIQKKISVVLTLAPYLQEYSC